MEEHSSSSSTDSPQTTTPTQTIIITPSQLEKMGLIDQVKDMAQSQKQKRTEPTAETPNNTKELKIDPKKMKSKLCTLLNHTPLVMQVKSLNWVASEKKDVQTDHAYTASEDRRSSPTFSITRSLLSQKSDQSSSANEDQDSNPKFIIVSDEKFHLSPLEIESMLSSGKAIKSDDTISSIQKSRPESSRTSEATIVVKSNENSNESDEVSETTSKDTASESALLKKEGLKRIQAKMYENLKKVLDEVDSLPLKDRASISIKPLTNAEDTKLLPAKQSEIDKIMEKSKENKPCYMSSYRERKLSQDSEKVKETKDTIDKDIIEIDIQPPNIKYKGKTHKVSSPIGEVIKIDDESDGIVKIPKKRKPPVDIVGIVQINDIDNEKIIEIVDNDADESRKNSGPPKKALVKKLYQAIKEPELKKIKKRDKDPDVVFKGSAKMIRTSISVQDSPRQRGRYNRKARKIETVNIDVKIDVDEIDSEPENTSKIIISSSSSSEPPKRKRGRPRKIRIDEIISPQEVDKPDAIQTKTVEVEVPKPVSSTEPTPRKRGRPPKIRPVVSQDSDQTSTPKQTQSIPKTESKSEDSETTIDKLETPTQSESQNNNTPVVKVHKKRGRKSKAELAMLKQEATLDESVSEEKYTKSRTSGRKRKIVDYNMLNGEDSAAEEPDSDPVEPQMKRQKRTYRRVTKLDQSRDKSSNDEYGSSNAIGKKRTESENSENVGDSKKIEENKDEDSGIDKNKQDGNSEEIQDGKKVEQNDGKDDDKDDKEGESSEEIAESKTVEKNEGEGDIEEENEREENSENIADSADVEKVDEKNDNEDKDNESDHSEEIIDNKNGVSNDESKQSENSEGIADVKKTEGEDVAKDNSKVKDNLDENCERLIVDKGVDKIEDKKSGEVKKQSEDSVDVTEDKEIEESEEKDDTNKEQRAEDDEKVSESTSNEETKLKDDEVRCAICEEVVQQDSWSQHKRKVHNDLAWFSGEQPLNLDDIAVVEEILNAILQEDGVLKCANCDIQTDSMESFVQHYQDSNMCLVKNKMCDKTDSDGRGRKRKKPGGADEVLTFLFTNFTKNRNDEPSAVNDDDPVPQENHSQVAENQVQCAVCSKIIPKTSWFNHRRSMHNNLAWRVGDKPLDLNNRSVVMKILHALYMKKKHLYCDVCGGSRKSVLGFLSHKSQCQKSQDEISSIKVSCTLCHRKMLPVSLARHIDLSHKIPSTEVEQRINFQEDTNVGRKRKAANKAFELIRNIKDEDSTKITNILKGVRFRSCDEVITKFNEDVQNYSEASCVYENCSYTANDAEDLFQHMENCKERCTPGYTCNFCLATFKFKKFIVRHVLTTHPHNDRDNLIIKEVLSDDEIGLNDDEGISDNDDRDIVVYGEQSYHKQQKWNQPKILFKFLRQCRKKPINSCFSNVYKWTLDYHKESFTAKNLFSHAISWEKLDDSEIFHYLPKLKRSIDTATLKLNQLNDPNKQNYEWKNYKLFQSEVDNDGTMTIFCGGPISAMAWVPIPQELIQKEQILAIGTLPDPDNKYYGAHKYRDKGLIQFWNFGVLNNRTTPDSKPNFEFCLAHDHGIVWGLEWCPSGCFDGDEVESFRRLGLLAMACSDSNVYIYSIMKPNQIPGKLFRSIPKFKLILETSYDVDWGEISYHATKISWSKCAGHSYVAVGYSNGAIGIFNLNTKSKLLYKMEDGVIVLKPILAFKAHNDCVTALALHHMNKGNRWLISGSLDRETKLWDLKNILEPLNVIKRYIITDAVWMIHWLCAIYTFEHCNIFGCVPSALVQARNYNGPTNTFLPTNSGATSISSSDWGNLFVQANDSGEVVCGFPDQLFFGFDDKRRLVKSCRTLASYTAYVAKQLTPEERSKKDEMKVEIFRKRKDWNDCGDMNLSEPKTYTDVCNSYGLVFCDMNMESKLKDPSQELDTLLQSVPFHSMSKPDVYPVQSINKIVLNPNKNSYLFYSCGYQVGFVRTSLLKFLNN